MPPQEVCGQHQQIATDIAVIKNDMAYIKDNFCKHITQGEEKGGFRDRLIVAEQAIAALRTSVWKIGIVSGLIGALLGNIVPEAINLLSKWIVGK